MGEINIEQIKEYNKNLKEQKERASKLEAEIKFNTGEIQNLCNELSSELGREVNINNISEIYTELVNKITNTLKTGNEFLARIKQDENEANMETEVSIPESVDNVPKETVQVEQTVPVSVPQQPSVVEQVGVVPNSNPSNIIPNLPIFDEEDDEYDEDDDNNSDLKNIFGI